METKSVFCMRTFVWVRIFSTLAISGVSKYVTEIDLAKIIFHDSREINVMMVKLDRKRLRESMKQ